MEAYDKHAYKIILTSAILTVAGGSLFFHVFEKLSWVDAYYFSVVSLATVGYGDIVPKTNGEKLFATLYIFVGVGIITAFISATMKRRGYKLKEKYEKKQKEKS